MRRFLPYLIALFGLAAGTVTGHFLRPVAEPAAEGTAPVDAALGSPAPVPPREDKAGDFVRLNNQFIVPLVEGGRIAGMVVLTLTVEVVPGATQLVFDNEPRLRDALLRALFEHANAGGFAANYTRPSAMAALRTALVETARGVLGASLRDVLILDVLRQDT